MGRDLADNFAEAREVFAAVDSALCEPLSRLMFEGPEDELVLTRNAQPALMAVSVAVVRVIEAKGGRPLADLADYVAGHSLGEYSALAAAGAIDVGTTARLLRLRGEAMQSAVPVGEGAMAAVLGLDLVAVREVAAAAGAIGVCDVANDNADGQVVVSGAHAAVVRAVDLAREAGAKRSILLPVSAPFHCALMAPAAEAMAAAFADVAWAVPSVPLVSNVEAAAIDDLAVIQARLVDQVTGMVRWRESVQWMAANGVTRLVEVGAGKVLTGLVKRIDRALVAEALGSPAEIEAFVSAAAE